MQQVVPGTLDHSSTESPQRDKLPRFVVDLGEPPHLNVRPNLSMRTHEYNGVPLTLKGPSETWLEVDLEPMKSKYQVHRSHDTKEAGELQSITTELRAFLTARLPSIERTKIDCVVNSLLITLNKQELSSYVEMTAQVQGRLLVWVTNVQIPLTTIPEAILPVGNITCPAKRAEAILKF